jgi:hypothetical protein
MILGKLGEEVKEEFSVLDNTNTLVTGIPLDEFSAHLFDPSDNEVYDSTSVSFIELGHGHYRVIYTPNQIGNWMLIVYHPTHFPWGKSNTIQVFANDFDSIAMMLQKILGLVQENFSVDNTIYDENNNLTSSRVRIYTDSSSVGTNNNVLETYLMTAEYSGLLMTSYKMEKI